MAPKDSGTISVILNGVSLPFLDESEFSFEPNNVAVAIGSHLPGEKPARGNAGRNTREDTIATGGQSLSVPGTH